MSALALGHMLPCLKPVHSFAVLSVLTEHRTCCAPALLYISHAHACFVLSVSILLLAKLTPTRPSGGSFGKSFPTATPWLIYIYYTIQSCTINSVFQTAIWPAVCIYLSTQLLYYSGKNDTSLSLLLAQPKYCTHSRLITIFEYNHRNKRSN